MLKPPANECTQIARLSGLVVVAATLVGLDTATLGAAPMQCGAKIAMTAATISARVIAIEPTDLLFLSAGAMIVWLWLVQRMRTEGAWRKLPKPARLVMRVGANAPPSRRSRISTHIGGRNGP
jgi:hypothetical protein